MIPDVRKIAIGVRSAGGNPVRWVTSPSQRSDALEAEVLAAGLVVEYDAKCPPDYGYILSDRLYI